MLQGPCLRTLIADAAGHVLQVEAARKETERILAEQQAEVDRRKADMVRPHLRLGISHVQTACLQRLPLARPAAERCCCMCAPPHPPHKPARGVQVKRDEAREVAKAVRMEEARLKNEEARLKAAQRIMAALTADKTIQQTKREKFNEKQSLNSTRRA